MQEITVPEAHEMLRRYIRSRSDLGIRNAIDAAILKPQNPFEATSARKPQPWFVLFLISIFALVAAFTYFNLCN
jgi:hypothetical protein